MRKTSLLLAFCSLGVVAAGLTRAQAPQPATTTPSARSATHPDAAPSPADDGDARWKDSFDAFAAADKLHAPVAGGVVFVGSSSIRLWTGLETAFEDNPAVIVKRGFGGSRLLDCVRNLGRLVLIYKPRLVVVYAGDNDLAEGRSPQQVLESFVSLVEGVRKALPETRIAFMSIKPSPLRIALLEQTRQANSLIKAYAGTVPNVEFVDVFSGMVDAHGRPRTDLFLPDRLHLNAAGYALWRQAIAPHLR